MAHHRGTSTSGVIRLCGSRIAATCTSTRGTSMRRVVTGIGDDGRSTVCADGHAPVAFAPQPDGAGAFGLRRIEGGTVEPGKGSSVVNELWALTADPSVTTIDFARLALELRSASTSPRARPGGSSPRWVPVSGTPMHSTPTDRLRDRRRRRRRVGPRDGSVHLHAADAVVVNGVEHSWLAGPDGCVIATVMVGLRESER